MTHKSQLIRPRRIAKIIADTHHDVLNPSIRLSVRKIIRIPIMADTKPKVRKFSGNVMARKISPTVALTTHNTTATMIAVHKPSISTPGVRYAAIATAIPDTIRLRMNLSIVEGL